MSRTIEYHKLVRDKIPNVIAEAGNVADIAVLSTERYLEELDKKLDEEIQEFRGSRDAEEIADVLEVVYAMIDALGLQRSDVERIRADKAQDRGGFRERIFLKSVTINK